MRKIGDYTDLLKALKDSFIQELEFTCEPDLTSVLRNPRLIVILNHSTPLSWVPAISTLGLKVAECGGEDRIPRGIADKWFYSNPIGAKFAEFFTQSATPQTFEQLIEEFKEAQRKDLVIFPEGANTFFGDVRKVQDFRSSKFVEISIRCQAPILIVSHQGSEHWSTSLEVPAQLGQWITPLAPFFGKKISEFSSLNIPISFSKIKKFKMHCQLYMPTLYEADLSVDPIQRKHQLDQEASMIKEIMEDNLDV
jgi:hypothetical protein